MLKKVVLTVFVAMLIVFGAGISYANQVDGMASGTGPALPDALRASVNPGGLGDSLIYGYYNVRGNLNLFNIVNTSATDGAKVRVVFRNGKNSKECLDFSVCLSKGDVWTAYLVDNGTTAALCPYDTDTATAPAIPTNCVPFKYEGSGGLTGVTADDCREGYFEVIGLSDIPNFDHNTCTAGATCPKTESTCRDYTSEVDVANVLMGNNSIFDLATLATYSYNATAIADTSPIVIPQPPAGTELSVAAAMFDYDGDGSGCNELDYILMKDTIMSPYDLISAIGGETELIITFPTRLRCHDTAATTDLFDGDTDPATSGIQYCTTIGVAVWDDKEHRLDITDFSPSTGLCLRNEVNVIKLGGSDIWDSKLANTVSVGTYELGWIAVDLYAGDTDHDLTYPGTTGWTNYVTVYGLPAITYTTQSFVGGAASYMVPTAYGTRIY